MNSQPSRMVAALAVAAIAFGILTVFSGGRALFGTEAARAELGNIVPFVLWFNFVAGFAYVGAGVALLRAQRRAAAAALLLAAATVLVFLALAAHILSGGLYEMRTVGALSIRSLFWIVVAVVALRTLRPRPAPGEPQ
jgi:hypothetical protein